jgi:hypothetical protein
MSLSRQVLSSPFDWDAKSDDRTEKEDESVVPINIMVDKRIRRRSTLVANASQAKPADITQLCMNKQPGGNLFDSRPLRSGDSEAKLTVSTPVKKASESIESIAYGNRRAISTPSPVNDRHHISVQTDDEEEVAARCQREKSTQTLLQNCAL